jgi:hypothetical protein
LTLGDKGRTSGHLLKTNKSDYGLPPTGTSCIIGTLFISTSTLTELRVWEPYGFF